MKAIYIYILEFYIEIDSLKKINDDYVILHLHLHIILYTVKIVQYATSFL